MNNTYNDLIEYLKLDKPIIFFDLETTGVKPFLDRIVEVSAIKVSTNGLEEFKTKRLNPEIPIPLEATNIHGIEDKDVKDCPTFKQIARSLYEFFSDCHIAGFGIKNFDIKILQHEFKRANINFIVEGRAIIDALTIYHKKEPRDLNAAMKFYCNKDLINAHSSRADVDATIEILHGQLNKYEDLPKDIYKLNDYCSKRNPDYVDSEGKLILFNNEIYITFGKHAGLSLKDILKNDKDYLEWILKGNFDEDVKNTIVTFLNKSY